MTVNTNIARASYLVNSQCCFIYAAAIDCTNSLCYTYAMNFKTYYRNLTASEKSALASRLDTSLAYLSQLAYGHRKAGAKFLLRIEKATGGKVTPTGLRQDAA